MQYLAEYGDGANEVNRFTGDDDDDDDDQTNQVRGQTIGVMMTWYTDNFFGFSIKLPNKLNTQNKKIWKRDKN